MQKLAAASGVEMPQAAINLELIHAAERSVGDDADFSAVATHLRTDTRGDDR
jgi:hypothetical protein